MKCNYNNSLHILIYSSTSRLSFSMFLSVTQLSDNSKIRTFSLALHPPVCLYVFPSFSRLSLSRFLALKIPQMHIYTYAYKHILLPIKMLGEKIG